LRSSGIPAAREKDTRFLVAGWFVVIVLLLQIKRIRYIIPLFPLFALMASYGLNEIRDKGMKKFVSLCIVASSLVIAYGAYLPFLNRTSFANLKQAGRYLDTLDCAYVEVHALPQKSSSGSTFTAIPILDYHTEKTLVSPQEWPTRRGEENTRSSLRFTWEMTKPGFYSQPRWTIRRRRPDSGESLDRVPQGIRQGFEFDLRSDVLNTRRS
jgi:uncharacterized membrane protein (GlpM family)